MRVAQFSVLAICFSASALLAQVPTIINEIDQLESVRDPKCYATASRLEDFIYGTPLDFDARAEKIALQKQFIRDLWLKASAAAASAGKTQIDVGTLRPILQAAVPYAATAGGDWVVRPDGARRTEISARDRRQYGTVAYALRAILAVQQDAFVDGTKILPLDAPAVELFKESIDLVTLAALQHADHATRSTNHERLGAKELKAGWSDVVGHAPAAAPEAKPTHAASATTPQKFATINAIVAEKLAAYEKYNDLSQAVFLRNVQVYMSRHMWPTDPAEGKAFKDQFTETMIAWTGDVMLEAEKRAKKRGHALSASKTFMTPCNCSSRMCSTNTKTASTSHGYRRRSKSSSRHTTSMPSAIPACTGSTSKKFWAIRSTKGRWSRIRSRRSC